MLVCKTFEDSKHIVGRFFKDVTGDKRKSSAYSETKLSDLFVQSELRLPPNNGSK